jgi:hypothetical protein
MSQETWTDTRSPWYEVFSRHVEAQAEPAKSEPASQPADETWATEAVFGSYND